VAAVAEDIELRKALKRFWKKDVVMNALVRKEVKNRTDHRNLVRERRIARREERLRLRRAKERPVEEEAAYTLEVIKYFKGEPLTEDDLRQAEETEYDISDDLLDHICDDCFYAIMES
jgi:hypothetical protein